MQREIKFRAWCKDGGPDRKGCMTTLNNEEIDDCLECGDPVMQYTGLHDSAGQEIYEDDIVKAVLITYTREKEGHTGKVVFNDFEYCIETEDSHWPMISWKCVTEVEVIGNIHQHPDLLRKD